MQKLIDIPSSIEIEQLDDFAIKYIGKYLSEKGITNWSKFIVILNQKTGHSTKIITYKKTLIEFRDCTFQEIDVSDDINLNRITHRVLKRTKKEKVIIEIVKDTSLNIY